MVLVVDDEPGLRDMLGILFRRDGYDVTLAPGLIAHAVYAGHRYARELDEPAVDAHEDVAGLQLAFATAKQSKARGMTPTIAILTDGRGNIALDGSADRAVAEEDALRLAKGMSYKAALAGLQQGGGKAVIMRPAHVDNRAAVFEAFGRFIETLNGHYITAMDSGTSSADMDCIAQHTQHVTSTTAEGDPSPHTAMGVFAGIRATSYARLGSYNLEGLRVAIQGLGNVGYALAEQLLGWRLPVSGLPDWIEGRPVPTRPARVERDGSRAVLIEQDGWTVRIAETFAASDRPRLIVLERAASPPAPGVVLRLVVDDPAA